jgi:hypothetical protein
MTDKAWEKRGETDPYLSNYGRLGHYHVTSIATLEANYGVAAVATAANPYR